MKSNWGGEIEEPWTEIVEEIMNELIADEKTMYTVFQLLNEKLGRDLTFASL